MTVDLLLHLERTLEVLRRRSWSHDRAGTLEGSDPVSLCVAVEIATSGRAGGAVADAYKQTVIAVARRIVRRHVELDLPAPQLAWCMRQSSPGWLAAEQLIEHWDGAADRLFCDVEQVLGDEIDEVGAVVENGAMGGAA